MRIYDVNIFQVETFERSLKTLDDVFPRKTMVVDKDLAVDGAPIDLCKSESAID